MGVAKDRMQTAHNVVSWKSPKYNSERQIFFMSLYTDESSHLNSDTFENNSIYFL